jgi:hypothetical protein
VPRFGSPADSESPVVLRTRLATGVLLSAGACSYFSAVRRLQGVSAENPLNPETRDVLDIRMRITTQLNSRLADPSLECPGFVDI